MTKAISQINQSDFLQRISLRHMTRRKSERLTLAIGKPAIITAPSTSNGARQIVAKIDDVSNGEGFTLKVSPVSDLVASALNRVLGNRNDEAISTLSGDIKEVQIGKRWKVDVLSTSQLRKLIQESSVPPRIVPREQGESLGIRYNEARAFIRPQHLENGQVIAFLLKNRKTTEYDLAIGPLRMFVHKDDKNLTPDEYYFRTNLSGGARVLDDEDLVLVVDYFLKSLEKRNVLSFREGIAIQVLEKLKAVHGDLPGVNFIDQFSTDASFQRSTDNVVGDHDIVWVSKTPFRLNNQGKVENLYKSTDEVEELLQKAKDSGEIIVLRLFSKSRKKMEVVVAKVNSFKREENSIKVDFNHKPFGDQLIPTREYAYNAGESWERPGFSTEQKKRAYSETLVWDMVDTNYFENMTLGEEDATHLVLG